MPPRPTTTMVVIIRLLLIMLPRPQTRAMTSAAEVGYGAADQPYCNNLLTNGSPTGYLSSLSPIASSAIPFSKISAADSSISSPSSPLTLPSTGTGDLPATGRRSCTQEDPMMNSSRTLEPEIFCASHCRPLESIDDRRMIPPETKKRLTHCCPVNGCYGVCCAYRIQSSVKSVDPLARAQLIASWIEYFRTAPGLYCSRIPYFYYEDNVEDANYSEASRATQSANFRQRRTESARHGKTRGNLQTHRPALDPKQQILTTAVITAASALLALLCTIAGLLLWCKRNKKSDKVEEPVRRTELCPSAPRRYNHSELAVATQGFADEAKIGRGGFGPVYRGYLADQDRHVAVKVLSQGSSVQGAKEFEAEVRVMTRLRHRNIVELVGWCDNGPNRDLLLVYEFVPKGSLDKHLYDPQRVLPWSDRYKIALGVGSAILYLHTECEECVVHGDIKPANIMLDASFNAKLGDFGLARFVAHGADPRTTQVVAGTLGYIDPEFVNSRRPSAESDVYSFGVVLLETACGRQPTTSTLQSSRTPALVNWVRDMYRQDSILGAADRRLDGEFDEQQMRSVFVAGLWCTRQDQSQRPSIAQAMDVLRREDAELPVLGPEMHSIAFADAVRSLEERAYGDLSGEDSPAETEYHTSEQRETTYLLARE